MESIGIEKQVSITLEDHEIDYISDSESVSPSFDQFDVFKRNGMMRIEERKNEHEIVKQSFLEGMGTFSEDTDIVAIHRNSYSGVTGQARFETFQIFSEAVAKKRGGNANVKYAWYGSSKDEICDIFSHGFSRCGAIENRELHGHGVYLSPASFSIDGALSSAVDENGLRHLLLCRVILGNMEAISPAGSKQFKPTSKEFDSGVDDVLAPRRYIIWSAYMNSYILPSYIISFKAPSIDLPRTKAAAVRPNSPFMRFPNLMSLLANHLQPSKMALIAKYYSDFRENKIRRFQLIRRLRQIAGDELLAAVIKAYR